MSADFIFSGSRREFERKEFGRIYRGNGVFVSDEPQGEEETVLVPAYDAYYAVPQNFIKSLFENELLFDKLGELLNDAKGGKKEIPYLTFPKITLSLQNENGGRIISRDVEIPYAHLLSAAKIIYGEHPSKSALKRIRWFEKQFSINAMQQGSRDICMDIDGENYTVSKRELIEILTESDESLRKRCAEDREIAKKLYMLTAWVNPTKAREPYLFSRYSLPPSTMDRYADIEGMAFADFECVNRVFSKKTKLSDRVHISDKLRNAVLNDMPRDLNDLEKSLYIYGRLCQILAYDSKFYAADQKGEVAEEHENMLRLGTITPENNNIVCYEFAYIYAKLLEEQNIQHEVISMSKSKEYGGAHAYCMVRVGDIIFKADSTTTIFGGDLLNAKYGGRMVGIIPETKFNQKKQIVEEAMRKVDEHLRKYREQQTTVNLLQAYNGISNGHTPEFSVDDYIELLETGGKDVDEMSRMAYAIKMAKQMPQDMKLVATVLKRNTEKGSQVTAIIDYDTQENGREYLEYSATGEVRKVSLEELTDLIQSGTIESVIPNDARTKRLFTSVLDVAGGNQQDAEKSV